LLEQRRLSAAATTSPYDWFFDTPRLAPVLALARRVAATPSSPVIVTGERGVGVAELARFVHEETRTARIPSASPSAGRLWSMSAANAARPARHPELGAGTLVIDDVENLRPEAQQWLMDLLSGRCHPDGVSRMRVVATSRLVVEELLAHPGLSQELVHALDVVRLELPPLRHRPEEILPLAQRYLRHFARVMNRSVVGFSMAAQAKLLSHLYPANVRELRNTIERATALEPSEQIQADAIVFHGEGAALGGGRETGRKGAPAELPRVQALIRSPRLPTLAEIEREYLIVLIRQLRGRRVLISKAMGVSYPTVVKRIAQYGLDVRAILASEDQPDNSAGSASGFAPSAAPGLVPGGVAGGVAKTLSLPLSRGLTRSERVPGP
jgi:DNA-binding NtrC family response regulator